jgi:hypothetical protein
MNKSVNMGILTKIGLYSEHDVVFREGDGGSTLVLIANGLKLLEMQSHICCARGHSYIRWMVCSGFVWQFEHRFVTGLTLSRLRVVLCSLTLVQSVRI